MTADPLELLSRAHQLYVGDPIEPGVVDTPVRLPDQADRLIRVTAAPGAGSAAAWSGRLADGLRLTAAADAELLRLLGAARTDREVGRDRTRAILDDGHAERMPAADTPMGRREAMRRMANRLQSQYRHVHRSRRRAGLLARRMNRLAYLRRRQASAASPGHIRRRIAAALDHLGIDDPQARRNWTRGYQTLIARESGGRPWAVASESAGYGLGYARGLTQTIPATFAAYHQPGTSTNIYDPVANICASMNYVMRRYGVAADGSNLAALVQQADPHRPPKGY